MIYLIKGVDNVEFSVKLCIEMFKNAVGVMAYYYILENFICYIYTYLKR
jgi:hypothetical protein